MQNLQFDTTNANTGINTSNNVNNANGTVSLPPLTSLLNSNTESRTAHVPQLSSPMSMTVPTQVVLPQAQAQAQLLQQAQLQQPQQPQPMIYLQQADDNNIPATISKFNNLNTIPNTNYLAPSYNITSPMLINQQIPSPINSPEYLNNGNNTIKYSIPYKSNNTIPTSVNNNGLYIATQNLPQDYIYQSNIQLQRSISPLSNYSSNSNNLTNTIELNANSSCLQNNNQHNNIDTTNNENINISSVATHFTKKNTKMLNIKRETCDSITRELPKRRRRTTKEQKLILKEAFQQNKAPTKEERLKLAEKCNMSEKAIQVWFQNQRQYIRKEQNSRNLHFYQIIG